MSNLPETTALESQLFIRLATGANLSDVNSSKPSDLICYNSEGFVESAQADCSEQLHNHIRGQEIEV